MNALLILATGGTIDKIYYDALSDYHIGEPAAQSLLGTMQLSVQYEVQSLLKKDSLELNDADRTLLSTTVLQAQARSIIITHGTDTMNLSAATIEDDYHTHGKALDKIIVFTGAMQPAICKDSDASFNLGMAVGAVTYLSPGIYIAMSGVLAPHRAIRKNRQQNIFEYTTKTP